MGSVPIYEFDCERCGGRFEQLVSAGTAESACPECGEAARRVLSAPSAPFALSKAPGQARRMEDARGVGRGGAKERFKLARQKARERGGRKGGAA